MRFLIVTRSKHLIPPEAGPALIDAMTAWTDRMTRSKKMEQVWSFAGIPGGGGILNVDSLEELDAIMTEFPFGPFSEIEVYPLADLKAAMANFKRVMQQMAPPAR